jgi:hypothetical protein
VSRINFNFWNTLLLRSKINFKYYKKIKIVPKFFVVLIFGRNLQKILQLQRNRCPNNVNFFDAWSPKSAFPQRKTASLIQGRLCSDKKFKKSLISCHYTAYFFPNFAPKCPFFHTNSKIFALQKAVRSKIYSLDTSIAWSSVRELTVGLVSKDNWFKPRLNLCAVLNHHG